jgi:hypothetical protein
MINIKQFHEDKQVIFPIVGKESLNDWVAANTFEHKLPVGVRVAALVAEASFVGGVNPAGIKARLLSCYPADIHLAGMIMLELTTTTGNHHPATKSLMHIVLRTRIVREVEVLVGARVAPVGEIDLAWFKREEGAEIREAATLDDLREWFAVHRRSGPAGDVLFNQVRELLDTNSVNLDLMRVVKGDAYRRPQEGRRGLIKLDIVSGAVEDVVYATVKVYSTFLSKRDGFTLSTEHFAVVPSEYLWVTPKQGELKVLPVESEPAVTEPVAEPEVAAVVDTPAEPSPSHELNTPAQEADMSLEQAASQTNEPKPATDNRRLNPIHTRDYQLSHTDIIEWIKDHAIETRVSMADRMAAQIAALCRTLDVEPEHLRFIPRSIEAAGFVDKNNREAPGKLGLLDLYVLTPIEGRPMGEVRMGALLSFTTTAEPAHGYRTGSGYEWQDEKLMYLVDPNVRDTGYIQVAGATQFYHGIEAVAPFAVADTDNNRSLSARLWREIGGRYSRTAHYDERLVHQLRIKLMRVATPILHSNHTVQMGEFLGEVYTPGADPEKLFTFKVMTSLESVDERHLREIPDHYEIERPEIVQPPIYRRRKTEEERPSLREALRNGGKRVDVGSAANPIPDTDAVKTSPEQISELLDKGKDVVKPEVVRQPWREPSGSAPVSANMMQAGSSLRYMTVPEGVISFDEFVNWVMRNGSPEVLAAATIAQMSSHLQKRNVTSSHFFEMTSVILPKLAIGANHISTMSPGSIAFRAFDPDRAGSEVMLVVVTTARLTTDPWVWQECIAKLEVPERTVEGDALMDTRLGTVVHTRSEATKEPAAGVHLTTHIWIFFNHAMGGILMLIEDEEKAARVSNFVKYIDSLYPNKGESNESYELEYVVDSHVIVRVWEGTEELTVLYLDL